MVKKIRSKDFLFFLLSLTIISYVFVKIYSSLLVPIGVSCFLSFILAPVDTYFSKWKIPRSLTILSLLALTISFLIILVIKVLPPLYYELLYLVKKAPDVFEGFIESWLPSIKSFILSSNIMSEEDFDGFLSDFSGLSQISSRAYQALTTIWSTVPAVLGTVFNLVLIPLITYFLLIHKERLILFCKKLVPRSFLLPIEECSVKIITTLRSILKGQVLIASIMGGLYIIAFSIIGLPSAFVIGIISGLCRLVPYLDILVGGSLSLVVILSDFHGFTQIFAVVIVFTVIQSLDGMLLTPKIMGEKVGIHPLIVICSVIAFGNLFGLIGVLLAIPFVATFRDIAQFVIPYYFSSNFYKD